MTATVPRSTHAADPASRPAAAPDPTVRPRSRRVIRLLTVATLGYLAVQLAVGLTLRTDTWPVAGFPMFADAPTEHDEAHLAVIDSTGKHMNVVPPQLGITRDELAFWVGRHVAGAGGVLLPNGTAALGNLARAWHERYPTALRQITLTQTVTDLVHHRPDFTRTVATWTASGATP